jgi:aryl-alcohol dehydrogenase-like predicted oxidoreductase
MTASNISTRPLGKDGPQVTRVGLGFVGHGAVYGEPGSDEERLAFLDAAFDKGERFWDTGMSSLLALAPTIPMCT